MQHVSLEEELCNVVIENLAARWRHGGSGDDALGSRQSLRRQQGCAVMCGPQWEMHFSTLYLLILMTKSSHAHRGFYAATSATTFLLFSWQQQTWCVCFHSVTKQNKKTCCDITGRDEKNTSSCASVLLHDDMKEKKIDSDITSV